MNNGPSRQWLRWLPPGAGLVTLLAFLEASLYPDYRVWGINWWAYLSDQFPFLMFGVGAVVIAAVAVVSRLSFCHGLDSDDPHGNRIFRFGAIGLTVALGLLFYFLRTRMHFLGDGYTLLALLEQDNPLIKTRELGESLAHLWVFRLLGPSANAALQAYRIIAISSGVLFLLVAASGSARLFSRTTDRFLFLGALAAGGYMLNFFGYVENYSIFLLMVALYTFAGLLIARNEMSSFVIIPVQLLIIFFHVIGISLLPATIFILVRYTPARRFLQKLPGLIRWLLAGSMLVAAIVLFIHLYRTNYFFRFALVPPVAGRFTVEGYTLFSVAHLLDYTNLLFLLIPGLLVALTALLYLPVRVVVRRGDIQFLLIAAASSLGVIFVLDPKLGMPRDWDLFSFAGLVLAVLLFYALLIAARQRAYVRPVMLICIVLGVIHLFPRVASQGQPEVAIAHLRNHIELNPVKNRPVFTALAEYYRDSDDMVAFNLTEREWRERYPEVQMSQRSVDLIQEGRYDQAIDLLERAIEINPIFWGAYSNLARALLKKQQWDSALAVLQVTYGMNPHSAVTLNNLGYALMWRGRFDEAETAWQRAIALDSTMLPPYTFLVRLYQQQGRQEKYEEYLMKVCAHDDAPLEFIKMLAELHLRRGEEALAAAAFRRAINLGLDSTYVDSIKRLYPGLLN